MNNPHKWAVRLCPIHNDYTGHFDPENECSGCWNRRFLMRLAENMNLNDQLSPRKDK